MGAVECDGAADPAGFDQGGVDALPDLTPAPAVVDGGVWKVFAAAVTARCSLVQPMDDPADDTLIIDPTSTELVAWQ